MAATKKKTTDLGGFDGPVGELNAVEHRAPAEEPAPEPVPEPVPAPVITPDTDDGALRRDMLRVLKGRNLRNTVPTLVDFRMKGSQRRRYTIVDIDRDTVTAAWNLWREAKGSYDHEAFMLMLHDVMESGLPKVYRQVDPLRLEEDGSTAS